MERGWREGRVKFIGTKNIRTSYIKGLKYIFLACILMLLSPAMFLRTNT